MPVNQFHKVLHIVTPQIPENNKHVWYNRLSVPGLYLITTCTCSIYYNFFLIM